MFGLGKKETTIKDRPLLSSEDIKNRVSPICQKHGVKKMYMFGSYTKGTASEESDIDFHIVPGKVKTLIRLVALQEDLETVLGKKVDIITRIPDDETSKIFRNNVLREEVLLYAD